MDLMAQLSASPSSSRSSRGGTNPFRQMSPQLSSQDIDDNGKDEFQMMLLCDSPEQN